MHDRDFNARNYKTLASIDIAGVAGGRDEITYFSLSFGLSLARLSFANA